MAHHYDRGGNARKAVEYLGRAGKRSARQGAHSEAINYLNRTVELLEQLPDEADRVREELDLQMALAWSLTAARGGWSPEREAVLLRARELCERAGDNGRLMEVLLALAFLHSMRREIPIALELAKQVLALAEREQAEPMVRGAHFQLGITLYTAGRFQDAREHFERAPGFFGVAGSGAS